MIEKKQELFNQIQKVLETTGGLELVYGAFGDTPNMEGYVEKIIKPKEGGTFTKFYGCNYLFKGYPDKTIVEGIGIGKAFFSAIPREIILKSWLFKLSTLFLFLFQRKKFIHIVRTYFSIIHFHLMSKWDIPISEYNIVSKELKRAVDSVLDVESKKYKLDRKDDQGKTEEYDGEIIELLRDVFAFIYFFIDKDNAYRFRWQDIMEEMDKNILVNSPIKEINRLCKILISREYQIKHKWIKFRKMILVIMIFSPFFRRLVRDILLEINVEKVKFDEADWYFCQRRSGYDFRGIPISERLKEREKVDKEMGHYRIQQLTFKEPSGKETNGIQILPWTYDQA